MLKTSVGAAGAVFLLGNGYGSPAFADQLASTGTVAGGFVVNGRHLAFGADPQHQMAVAGQLFNLNTYNAVPSGIGVRVEYGTDLSYGAVATAELRELVTHVPVWNGNPYGPVQESTNDLLNASQFYVHAHLDNLQPGQTYHYRFVYSAGRQAGFTPDATFTTAPDPQTRQPFTFTAATNFGKSAVQAVSRSPRDAAVVHPATDGTTYVVVGSAGRPRYTWGGPVEADRNFIVGVDTSAPGNGTVVPGDQSAGTGPYVSQKNFTDHYETIDWSQARYRDYAFIALDVVPALPGGTTTMTLRAINQRGVEFDRVVFSRRAAEGHQPAPA